METETVKGNDFMIALPTPTTPAPKAQQMPTEEPAKVEPATIEPAKVEPETTKAVMLDDKGKPFDPAKHNPVINPTNGRWMPKGGRKSKLKAENTEIVDEPNLPKYDSFVAAPSAPQSEEPNQAESGKVPMDSKAAASTGTAILHVLSLRIFGANDGKFTPSEVAMLNEASMHVMDKRGVRLSPEMALLLAVGTVFGSRMTTPKGLSLVEKWKTRIVDWWAARNARRAGKYVAKTQAKAEEIQNDS
jgi:hypothetical protein